METPSNKFEKLIDPTRYQVFLFSCPAFIPFHFAIHPWFVVNKKGECSRWEVIDSKKYHGTHWGHLYKDFLPLFQEILMIVWTKIFWKNKTKLIGSVEGDEGSLAQKIADLITNSHESYPLLEKYVLTGPNSNTYAQWVLDSFPEWKIQLPVRAIGKNFDTKKNVLTAVVHGRFQPPHNGHLRYILKALAQAKLVIIGICTPAICTEEESERTGYPCTKALNPFTYDERFRMIRAALDEEKISHDRYLIIPFPSDYKNLDALIPKSSVFLMSDTGASDKEKKSHIESLGYKVKTIMETSEEKRLEKSGHIRTLAAGVDGEWEKLVPKAVAKIIKSENLAHRLKSDTMGS